MKSKRIIACIIARTVSTRLPLKVLRDVYQHTSMLDFLVQNVKSQAVCDEIYICTSKEAVDDVLEDVAERNDVKIYRGSPDEVTERMIAVGAMEKADILIRITGDNPFTASDLIPQQIKFLESNDLDYVRFSGLPVGATAEVFTVDALERCNRSMDPKVSEYLMLFLFEPRNFRTGVIKLTRQDYSSYSLTVDKPEDLKRTKQIVGYLGMNQNFRKFEFSEVLEIITNENHDLTEKKMKPRGEVKMPHDVKISFEEFQQDFQRRVRNSLTLNLYE